MKKLLGVLLMTVLSGAGVAFAETEEREVAPFDRIVFALPGTLTLSFGDEPAVVLHGDPEDLTRVETEVADDTLTVGWQSGLGSLWSRGPRGAIEVRVTIPALSALTVAGSGDVDGGSWTSGSLSVAVRGSGDVRFSSLSVENGELDISGSGNVEIGRLEADRVRIGIRGSGDVSVAGSAARQEIRVRGSGDVDAEGLESESAEVEVMGSGNVRVWATDRLDVNILGSGDVGYRGDPSVSRREAGSGRVERLAPEAS